MALSVSDIIHSPRSLLASLGKRVRAVRIAVNLSQAALASQVGVSRTTIVRLEQGLNIGTESLVRIAAALDATAEFAALFPAPEARSIDEILAAQRRPKRARRRSTVPR